MLAIYTALALGLWLLISKTKLGMKIRAGAFNSDMAQALGINIVRLHSLVFAMGVALAALGGMLIAPLSSVYPHMGSQVLIMCFVVVVIGGIGSVRGALTAALLVGLVDTFGKVLLPQFASMLVYVLMALVLLYKPEGLFKQSDGHPHDDLGHLCHELRFAARHHRLGVLGSCGLFWGSWLCLGFFVPRRCRSQLAHQFAFGCVGVCLAGFDHWVFCGPHPRYLLHHGHHGICANGVFPVF